MMQIHYVLQCQLANSKPSGAGYEPVFYGLWNYQHKAACKRTQHCLTTTPSIVGRYMLRPFAHPVACCWMLLRVVSQSLKPVKLLAPCRRTQHCWLTIPNIVGSCCSRLHVA